MWLKICVVSVLCLMIVHGLSEGEPCWKLDKEGICVNFLNCTSAKEETLNKNFPKVCSFKDKDPIVCCFDSKTNTNVKNGTKPIFASVEKRADQKSSDDGDHPDCSRIPEYYTAKKNGQLSWDKCVEYQHRLIFPCSKVTNTSKYVRQRQCVKFNEQNHFLAGSNGEDANEYEYAHMALLGYGNDLNSTQWLCGGTIISERFILTAAHCVITAIWGNVTRIATRMLKKSEIATEGQIYNVKRIVRHPEYKPPNKYHDIALLETAEEMKLDSYQVPACLHTGMYDRQAAVAVATGWGAVEYKGERPDVLQKMTLKKFDKEACIKHYRPYRLLKNGYNHTTQMCYGDPVENTDTCDGDSGGPLQIIHPDIYCMHIVIGVTSFGSHCGLVNQPAVYTRVEPYVPWIENIVWKTSYDDSAIYFLDN